MARIKNTGVPMNILKDVGKALSTVPEGFNLHPVIKKNLQARMRMINEEEVLLPLFTLYQVNLIEFSLLPQ